MPLLLQKSSFPADTEEAIAAMLAENTGAHMLDSGGAYGRHWEANRRVHPKDKPRLSFWSDTEWPSINVYHYLVELDGFDRTDAAVIHENGFRAWVDETPTFGANREAYNGCGSLETWLKLQGFRTTTGWVNTYNGDDYLSQVLQWAGFEDDAGNEYCALSIHQGCDVRGGYTDLRFFEVRYDAWPFGASALSFGCPSCAYEAYSWSAFDKPGTGTSLPLLPPVIRSKENRLDCPNCDGELLVGGA